MAQVKILNIYWKLASPFGEFVAGDSIDVYYDTDTDLFVVKKNNVTATSGAGFPPSWGTYNGLPDTDYRSEIIYQASICDDTTLVTFQRYPTFPYLFKYLYPNHASCVVPDPVNPLVCDLKFDSLPAVTNATNQTSYDGAITATASGSNGAAKYRLNTSNFAYDDGTGQDTGVFTGLGPGNYLIFARDASNCLSYISVTVGIVKTYGVKYRLEYYDPLENHHKDEILEKDYAGPVIEYKGGGTPSILSLRGEGEKDKFVAVLATELVLTLQSEIEQQFISLYTNDPEKYRQRHSINDVVVWTGKVQPNQYQENYLPPPYEIACVATDGLALLQDIYFVDDDNNRLTGEYKIISLIAWILKKIGLGLNIRSACNIYATGMNTADSDDPLDQAYVDVSRYYLITDVPTCWDVLHYLLEPFGAQIISYYNVWNIIRTEERANAFDYREFDSDGNYVSNGTYDPVKDLTIPTASNRMCWTDRNQVMNINPGYGTLRLLYNLGLKDNLLVNGDFAVKKYSIYQANAGSGTPQLINGTIPDLSGFQLINNGTVIQTGIEDLGDGNIAVEMTCTEVGGYLQSQVQTLKLGNTESIRLTVKYKVFNTVTLTNFPSDVFYYNKVKVKVIYGDYYLTDSGQWSLSDSFILAYSKIDEQRKYQTIEIIADAPLPEYVDGEDFQVQFFISNAIDYDYTGTGLAIDPATYSSLKAVPTEFLKQGYRTEVFVNDGLLNYYELQVTDSAEDAPLIIEPDDYTGSAPFDVKWVRVAYVVAGVGILTTTSIDKIQVEVLNGDKRMVEVANYSKPMENQNTLKINKIIYHGSLIKNGSTNYTPGLFPTDFLNSGVDIGGSDPLAALFDKYYINSLVGVIQFTAESADLIYSGYLRDSNGIGFTTWTRDAVAELATLEAIFQAMITAQYNKPWNTISGNMTGDILFTPIDVINELFGLKKYFPVAMEIDYLRNKYTTNQFLELYDVTNAEGEGDAAFTLGFSLGYES
jgi:hypothetical protein